MAVRVEGLQERDLLRDYLRALNRRGGLDPKTLSPGWELRSCAGCGRRAPFRLDPDGDWASCARCGSYA